MKAIVIDAATKTVSEFDCPSDIENLCPRVMQIATAVSGDGIFVDRENLSRGRDSEHVCLTNGVGVTAFGKPVWVERCLVIGIAEDGAVQDCVTSVTDLRANIRFQ